MMIFKQKNHPKKIKAFNFIHFSLIVALYLFYALFSIQKDAFANPAQNEQIATGRKIQFVQSIYPYSTDRGVTLRGEGMGIPKGIAIDPEGKLFAIFFDLMKIQVFSIEGRFRYEFGEKGGGEGKFVLPLDIEISADGKVFLLDAKQHKILVYDNKGRFLFEFSIVKGMDKGEKPVRANKIGLDSKNGILYVSDTANSVLRRFSLEGEYIDKFGNFGHGEGEFSFPGQVTFDNQGNIYIIDMANTRVQVFGPDRRYKFSFGNFGDSLGEFARPNAIIIDTRERIYVLDRLLSAIQVFDKQGNVLGVIKDLDEPNALRNSAPFDMTIDQEDRIFISAQDYHSIKVIKDLE